MRRSRLPAQRALPLCAAVRTRISFAACPAPLTYERAPRRSAVARLRAPATVTIPAARIATSVSAADPPPLGCTWAASQRAPALELERFEADAGNAARARTA